MMIMKQAVLMNILFQLLSTIIVDPCKPDPCNNGGNCSGDGKGGFNCACINGYSGQTCNDGIYKKNIL